MRVREAWRGTLGEGLLLRHAWDDGEMLATATANTGVLPLRFASVEMTGVVVGVGESNGNGNGNGQGQGQYGGPSPYRVRMTAKNWQRQRQGQGQGQGQEQGQRQGQRQQQRQRPIQWSFPLQGQDDGSLGGAIGVLQIPAG